MIDWKRIAKPQADQYDTWVAMESARQNPLSQFRSIAWQKPRGPFRTFFDGQVYIRHHHAECPYGGLDNAPLDAPALSGAADYVRRWPEVFTQFQQLIHSVHPLCDPDEPEGGHFASCSGCSEEEYGLIYATVEHPITLAEALVHEMAHQKLHALGLGVEESARFFTNPPEGLYESPVIRDRPRPMLAVFHAEYTFTHIVHLDCRLLRVESDPKLVAVLLSLMAYSLVRIEAGFDILHHHAQLDTDGRLLLDGFYAWADEVITEANALLDQHKHPHATLPELAYAF